MAEVGFTSAFRDELAYVLEQSVGKRFNFSTEEIQYARGKYKIIFDIYLESSTKIIVIEIEMRRPDPIHNVIKTAHWLVSSRKKKKVYLIQLFNSSYFCGKKRTSRDFCIFLGKRLFLILHKQPYFYYKNIDFSISPKDYRSYNDAKILKKRVNSVLKSIIKYLKVT